MQKQTKRIKDIIIFKNLNVAVFDTDGKQVPELQSSLLDLFATRAESYGYNPEGWIIETPGGNWKMFRTEVGWNRTQT